MAQCWARGQGMAEERGAGQGSAWKALASSSGHPVIGLDTNDRVYTSNMAQWAGKVGFPSYVTGVQRRIPDKSLLLGLNLGYEICLITYTRRCILLLNRGKKVRSSHGSELTDRVTEGSRGVKEHRGAGTRARKTSLCILLPNTVLGICRCLINTCCMSNPELSSETQLPQEIDPYGSIYWVI